MNTINAKNVILLLSFVPYSMAWLFSALTPNAKLLIVGRIKHTVKVAMVCAPAV